MANTNKGGMLNCQTSYDQFMLISALFSGISIRKPS